MKRTVRIVDQIIVEFTERQWIPLSELNRIANGGFAGHRTALRKRGAAFTHRQHPETGETEVSMITAPRVSKKGLLFMDVMQDGQWHSTSDLIERGISRPRQNVSYYRSQGIKILSRKSAVTGETEYKIEPENKVGQDETQNTGTRQGSAGNSPPQS